MTAIESSKSRTPERLAARSASLRNITMSGVSPEAQIVLHDAADMLYDASCELGALREIVADALAMAEQDRKATGDARIAALCHVLRAGLPAVL